MPREAQLQIFFIVGLGALLGGWLVGGAQVTVLLMIGAFFGAFPVVWRAIREVRAGNWASMDTLASLALLLSLVSGSWASAIFIELMLAAARLLSVLTEARTGRSIESLLKLRPDTAKVRRGGAVSIIPVGDVRVGDEVVVDAGTRIAVDGTVASGEGAVDQATLTGESFPVDVMAGSPVFASTLLASGTIVMRAEKVGRDTTLERIVRLVETAQKSKSRISTIAERFGKMYLVLAFAGAGLLAIVTRDLNLVLSVVLVVCADDIAVAIPLAYMGAIGSAAKHGVVIKGAAYLEVLGRSKTFVFDKTGTLTEGKLIVSHAFAASATTQEEVFALSASASLGSNHPLSKAIVAHVLALGIKAQQPDSMQGVSGKGVISSLEGSRIIVGREAFLLSEGVAIPPEITDAGGRFADAGESVVFVAKDGAAVGVLALSDHIRPEAKAALAALRTLGVTRLVMLTGDHARAAKSVAQELGFDEWHGGLLPEDKIEALRGYMQQGEVVMVGDGVNDAAALTAATVGIAMGAIGYDTAIESADIVLMRDDLTAVAKVIAIARKTHRISMEDFLIWGVTNIFGLALVFTGVIGPAGAAAYNFISDFFPLINSGRTRFISGPRP